MRYECMWKYSRSFCSSIGMYNLSIYEGTYSCDNVPFRFCHPSASPLPSMRNICSVAVAPTVSASPQDYFASSSNVYIAVVRTDAQERTMLCSPLPHNNIQGLFWSASAAASTSAHRFAMMSSFQSGWKCRTLRQYWWYIARSSSSSAFRRSCQRLCLANSSRISMHTWCGACFLRANQKFLPSASWFNSSHPLAVGTLQRCRLRAWLASLPATSASWSGVIHCKGLAWVGFATGYNESIVARSAPWPDPATSLPPFGWLTPAAPLLPMATGWCRPHCRAPFAQDCAGRLADRTVAQRIQNVNLQRKPLNYFSKSLLHETQCCSLFQSFTFPCMRFNQRRTQLIMLNEPNHAFHLSIFYVSLSSRFGQDTAASMRFECHAVTSSLLNASATDHAWTMPSS